MHAQLFNSAGDAAFEFGVAHRNTVLWSPHGRFLCLGVRRCILCALPVPVSTRYHSLSFVINRLHPSSTFIQCCVPHVLSSLCLSCIAGASSNTVDVANQGFGNMAGGLDFWDRNKQKKIGVTQVRSSVCVRTFLITFSHPID